jgi:hypothetical protein
MAGRGTILGRKQEEAIAALLSQRSIEEAARACGVGARTLIRWLKLPEFNTAYRDARRAAVSQSVARLQQATSAAVTTLLKVMVDPSTPASAKVRAADSVLDHAAKAIEIEDIEARVAELERSADLANPGYGGIDVSLAQLRKRYWCRWKFELPRKDTLPGSSTLGRSPSGLNAKELGRFLPERAAETSRFQTITQE